MDTKDQKNTSSQESQTSENGERFLLPGEYLDDKSARISVKGGKTIYEIEVPFGIEDYREVSKEEYDQYVQETKIARETIIKQQQDENKQIQQHNKKLKEIGYISTNDEKKGDLFYEHRLLDVLENNQIEHLKQIPGYVERETKENQIQLFQTLAKKEKIPDIYEQEIIAFLEKHEHTHKNAPISSEQIIYISTLFVRGYIDNMQLFYRFEQLKSKNTKNHYKRLYLFGQDNDLSAPILDEKEFLNDDEMSLILYFLNNKEGTISDLDDETKFKNKIKASYIHGLKEFRFCRGRLWFGKTYSGFNQKKLTHTLGFTNEDFENWSKQAEKEFVSDFFGMITNMNIDSITFPLQKIQEHITRIGKSTDTNNIKNAISIGLKQCIAQGIQKILNKEKLTACVWKERKKVSQL